MEGWVDLGYPAMHRPGVVEPAISWSQVERPNHYTCTPPNNPGVGLWEVHPITQQRILLQKVSQFTFGNAAKPVVSHERLDSVAQQARKARWIGRNSGPIVVFCGPKFTRLSAHAQEENCSVQLSFLFDDILFYVLWRCLKWNLPQIVLFWGRQIISGRAAKFLTQFYKLESTSNMCQNLASIDRATSQN